MHVYFCGIGGTGIGPLSLIAMQAGYTVSGSDKSDSNYVKYLHKKGIKYISIGQSKSSIKELHSRQPIDWIVYSSAVPKENPDHPELIFANENGIKSSKRDEFLNELLKNSDQKMIAVAGTHGKTTTTAMIIWLFKQLKIPISFSVGAKLSFGEMGEFDKKAKYFVYEADEYDRNFLSFKPEMATIPGIDYDHPDIYPTRELYYQAFIEFFNQSNKVTMWEQDAKKLNLSQDITHNILAEGTNLNDYKLVGNVNRANAHVAVVSLEKLKLANYEKLVEIINKFPGLSRRFEKITENLYTDYAHTPEKIRGALQMAHEFAGKKVVVVYEGLHNTRQHFIKDELDNLFKDAKKMYIVPSYLAREDENLEMLTPTKLRKLIKTPSSRVASELNENLKIDILRHLSDGDLVLCLSAGGGGSLDEWLRKIF